MVFLGFAWGFAGIRVLFSVLRALPFCGAAFAFGLSCDALLWFACVFAGIRDSLLVLHASPLCGAAPTFLCRGKEK